MKIIANIKLKNGVLDPQGKAIHHALSSLGFNEIEHVRVGKQIVLEINETDEQKAIKRAKLMCEELLANTVIEDYEIEIK